MVRPRELAQLEVREAQLPVGPRIVVVDLQYAPRFTDSFRKVLATQERVGMREEPLLLAVGRRTADRQGCQTSHKNEPL
jgi:hypothetical protein